MARFRGTLHGQGSQVSQLGSPKSGLVATINGWNVGIEVNAIYDPTTKKDVIGVWVTGGSNQPNHKRHQIIEVEGT